MTTLSAGTDDIVAQNGVIIAASGAVAITAGTYVNQTVTYNELKLQVEYGVK